MFRKTTAGMLLMLLMAMLVQPAFAATGSPLIDNLAAVETALLGAPQSGALLTRLESMEKLLDGEVAKSGESLLVRVNNLADRVTRGGLRGGSLLMKLNAIEWNVFQTQTSHLSLLTRLKSIEEQVLGEVKSNDGIVARIDNLLAMVWPGGALNVAQVQVTPAQKVRVKLLSELSSATSKENERVEYQVVEDLKVDNKIVIARDTRGVGVVKQVKKAGPFGQAGQIAIDFGTIAAIDGTPIALTIQPQTSDKPGQQELAAGASLGGMVLLGPLGLAAGYLVQGKAETIPVGTEVQLAVKDATTVQALSLVPVQ